ncbi:MAG: hypothetical protein V4508_00715 [Pseudomonadota bacterium]
MKPFSTIAALLLGLVALIHALRFVLGWPVTVNGFAVPAWASAIAFAVLGVLALMVWRERGR